MPSLYYFFSTFEKCSRIGLKSQTVAVLVLPGLFLDEGYTPTKGRFATFEQPGEAP